MDNCESGLDRIEAQRSTVVSQNQRKQRYSPINMIRRGILGSFSSLGFLQVEGEGTPPTGDTKYVPEFFTNIRFSDLYDLPGEYVPMNPEIVTAVSAGEKGWLEELLTSYGKPMACLKSDQGDYVLHLVAAWGRLELVKSIVSECPCLLELDSRDQLPLHVASRAGHVAVVEALGATVTFLTAGMSEEERESLNLYVVKDINGDTPLHLALKVCHMKKAACLVNANQRASFIANKDGLSPLYMAVEAGSASLVKAMLKTKENNGLEGKNVNLDSQLEGRKYLVHVALKARDTDILNDILKECPSLEDERDEEGRTCLSFGASIGFNDGVRYLLSRSTKSVYICNDDGSYPIHIAVEKRHNEVVDEIRRRCPNSIYLLNKQGQNILHIASKSRKVTLLFLHYFARTQLMEKQDMDGNTPLHLATINWRPGTIFLLILLNKKACMHTRNDNGLTALDIAESNLQPNYIFMERVTLMMLLNFNIPSRESKNSAGPPRPTFTTSKKKFHDTITRRSNPQADDKNKYYINTLLLVAALVGTVTFAAGFTIPGGFNSSAPNLGMATLASDYKLALFMILDILAMQSSILAISTLIWAQLGDPALVHRSLNVALPSLFFALLIMPMAFYYGVSVAFAHVKWLVKFLEFLSVIFLVLMIFFLGPHVFLQIPRIPAFFTPYFFLFVSLADENCDEKASDVKISAKDHMQKKEIT